METDIIPLENQGDALGAIERAQIDVQIATAKRYPRSLAKVKQDMLSFATLDEETASACFYTLPRGGKTIQGPSVRLAEIAVACWGNLRAGSRIISTVTDGEAPHVLTQSVAHDLEKNTAITIEKRRRITKKRGRDAIDEDDINLAANAGAAITFRDAVFKVVPQALIRPVMEAAMKLAVGDVKSLAKKRRQVVDRLKQMGITEDRIFAAVEADGIDDIDLKKLETLIGMGTALKDGSVTIEDAFPRVETKKPGASNRRADEGGGEGQAEAGGRTVGATPATGATPEPATPADDIPMGPTPLARTEAHDELEKVMGEEGVAFSQVATRALHLGWAPVSETSAWTCIEEIPEKLCRRIINARNSFFGGIVKQEES